MKSRLRGIFPPIPTTFDASGRVDRRAVGENIRRWMATDLTGVLALGSNGEAALLDEDESQAVVETAREHVPRDRVLLVGVGRESTKLTISAAKRAAKAGADAVLVRTPFFYKSQMTGEALYAHFHAVADASPVPVLLYNLPNVIGIKETSPDIERLGQFTGVRPDRFRVLCGCAPVVYPALVSGAAGAILAVANVLPDECCALYEHAHAGRHHEALDLQRKVTPLAQLVTTVHG